MGTFKDFSQALYDFHDSKKSEISYNSLHSLCEKSKDYFLQKLEEVDDSAFLPVFLRGKDGKDKKEQLLNTMRELTGRLNGIIKKEGNNDLEAPKEFYNELFREGGMAKYAGMACPIPRNTNFYRQRNAEKRYGRYDRKGMFLISDSNEHLVGAYRFNPSGYACLYLASNLYLAWEESRRPDFDTFNFSRFVNTRDLKVLDLTIQSRFKVLGHFVMAYLTLLCCAKATDGDKHHFQYVVPQLLMKTLCLSQCQTEENHGETIQGIRYLSSRRYDQKDFLFDEERLSIAYVFPQHPHDDGCDICPVLKRMFKLTEPRTYFLYKAHSLRFDTNIALVSDYQDTLFYQLERLTQYDKLDRV